MGNLGIQKCAHDPPLFHKRKRGQALIEAAITAPFLLLFVLGIIDVGRIVYSQIVITNAAREGAYYISYNPKDSAGGVQAAILEAQNSGVSLAGPPVPSCSPCKTDNPVTVTVQATIHGLFYYNTITISRSVEMQVVQ